MNERRPFLLFSVGPERYALDVAAVERIVPAAEVTPLPDAPGSVLGLIHVAGEPMPVIDSRRHFALPAKEMELTDHFIVARTSGRPLVLLVDRAERVEELSGMEVKGVVTGVSGSTSAVATLADGIVLIQDIEALASAAGIAGREGGPNGIRVDGGRGSADEHE